MSLDSNKTYIGSSNNVEKRLNAHNRSKGAKYTRGETWIHVLVIEGFLCKSSCLSFENVWKKVSKRRKQTNLMSIGMMSESDLRYTKDPKYNRIMDLLFLLSTTMMDGTKYRRDGTDIPNDLVVHVRSDEWIMDLPWPFYVTVKMIEL